MIQKNYKNILVELRGSKMNIKERYKKIKSVIKKLLKQTPDIYKPARITDSAVLLVIKSNWTRWR